MGAPLLGIIMADVFGELALLTTQTNRETFQQWLGS